MVRVENGILVDENGNKVRPEIGNPWHKRAIEIAEKIANGCQWKVKISSVTIGLYFECPACGQKHRNEEICEQVEGMPHEEIIYEILFSHLYKAENEGIRKTCSCGAELRITCDAYMNIVAETTNHLKEKENEYS